jgi:hypothetical protein
MANGIAERREFARYDTDVPANVTSKTMRMSVRMLSVSAGGALIRMDRLSAKVFDEDSFVLEISGVGRFRMAKKWRRDTDIGGKFDLSDGDRLYLAERLQDRFGGVRPAVAQVAAHAPRP